MAGTSNINKETNNSGESSDSSGAETESDQMPDDIEALKITLEAKEAEVSELKEQILRQKAEFDNFRKRSRREMEDFRKFAVENIMFDLLDVCDNFERVLFTFRKAEDVESVVNGVEMVFKQFISILEKEGLKKIECEGEEFDPHLHEATQHVESDQHPDNTIVEVCRPGYEFNSKVIRPARVAVSRQSSNKDDDSS
jgi:molecular chaperone GrpE